MSFKIRLNKTKAINFDYTSGAGIWLFCVLMKKPCQRHFKTCLWKHISCNFSCSLFRWRFFQRHFLKPL